MSNYPVMGLLLTCVMLHLHPGHFYIHLGPEVSSVIIIKYEFLQTIYNSCPTLKSLYVRGTFTDVEITGIRQRSDLDDFYAILMKYGNIVGEDVIEKHGVRQWKSILDLKQLETLTLSGEGVGDKSVLWGILGCTKKLKKLILPAKVTDKSLDALMGMKELRELCIPSPQEGYISFESNE